MGTCPYWDWMWGESASTGKPATPLYLCRCVSSGTVWAASWLSMLSATVRDPQGTALAAAAGKGASAVPRCGQAGGMVEGACPCVYLLRAEEEVAPQRKVVPGTPVGMMVSVVQRVIWE